MEKIIKEGKILEDIINEYKTENNLEDNDFVYNYHEKKGKLFQGNITEVSFYKKDSIIDEIKNYLNEIITNMGIEVNFEVSNNEDRFIIKIYSNNNAILIGKNGQTIKALENLSKVMLKNKYGISIKFSIDVENYKLKKDKYIERMAKQMAKEVVKTKSSIKLDSMTSYERRLVHNALTNFKGVTTESEGEEPNRCVVIKPN